MMSERRAPSALRRPISRVRSLTTISMMFMMTMPPTTSDSADDADQHREDAVGGRAGRCRGCVSDVNMPKLSGCFGFRRRAPRSATVASSWPRTICATSRGLTVSVERAARAEEHLELPERDERELVLRLAEQRPLSSR